MLLERRAIGGVPAVTAVESRPWVAPNRMTPARIGVSRISTAMVTSSRHSHAPSRPRDTQKARWFGRERWERYKELLYHAVKSRSLVMFEKVIDMLGGEVRWKFLSRLQDTVCTVAVMLDQLLRRSGPENQSFVI